MSGKLVKKGGLEIPGPGGNTSVGVGFEIKWKSGPKMPEVPMPDISVAKHDDDHIGPKLKRAGIKRD